MCMYGPGSSVGITIGYGLEGPGMETRWGRDIPHRSRPALGPETVPLDNTLVCSSEQLTWLKLRLGLVAKFGFGVFSGAAKGFRAGSV